MKMILRVINKLTSHLLLGLLISACASQLVSAEVQVTDDLGQVIRLKAPAKRIVSLAPHTTELLFDAGATDQVKGTVSYSDYPEQANRVPRIGQYDKFDLEAIVALKPDLIVAWQSGNNMTRIEEVMTLGIPVFVNEPREFLDVSESIKKLGVLLGTEKVAQARAQAYVDSLQKMKSLSHEKSKVRVFYQVWDNPLFTVNGEHLISKVIKLCGGENVFSDVSSLSPQISIEAVMKRDPDVIIAGVNQGRTHWLPAWKQWTGLSAVKHQQLYAIDADLIVRHTPRILKGAERMCEILDQVRAIKSNSK